MQVLAARLRFGTSARIPLAPEIACQLEAQAVAHEACFRSGKNVHVRFALASPPRSPALLSVVCGWPPATGRRPECTLHSKPHSSASRDSAAEQMPKPPRLSQPRNEFGAPPLHVASVYRHALSLRTHAMRSNVELRRTQRRGAANDRRKMAEGQRRASAAPCRCVSAAAPSWA